VISRRTHCRSNGLFAFAVIALRIVFLFGDAAGQTVKVDQDIKLDHITDLKSAIKEIDKLTKKAEQARSRNDLRTEAASLFQLASVESELENYQESLDAVTAAQPLFHQLNDQHNEAKTLDLMARYNEALGSYPNSITFFSQAQVLFHQLGDSFNEANEYNRIGNIYLNHLKSPLKALPEYSNAEKLFTVMGSPTAAIVLENIGVANYRAFRLQEALSFYNLALQHATTTHDRLTEAYSLDQIASVYRLLGDPQSALDLELRSFEIFKQLGDRSNEVEAAVDLGALLLELHKPQDTLTLYNSQLSTSNISLSLDKAAQQLISLNSAGAYEQLGQHAKATSEYTKLLSNPDDAFLAATLMGLGDVYHNQGISGKALDFYSRALPYAIASDDALLKAQVLYRVERELRSSNPKLAIFLGKQSIDLIQDLRDRNRDLDRDLQTSLLTSIEPIYRDTADVLIDEGRLAEAQEVIDMLRDKQFEGFTRSGSLSTTRAASQSTLERKIDTQYEQDTQHLLATYELWVALRDKANRTPDEQQRFANLDLQVKQGFTDYHSLLDNLDKVLVNNDKYKLDRSRDDVPGLANLVNSLDDGTVALYTLVTENRYRVIVIRDNHALVERHAEITATALHHLVSQYVSLLGNKESSPQAVLAASSKLYEILVAPVADDLKQANAQTLVWELDGVLRYVPIGALYSSTTKQFVVQQYATAIITPKDTASGTLRAKPDLQHSRLLAMGISHPYVKDFNELPNVPTELNSIVTDPNVAGSKGPFTGTEWLDDRFTEHNLQTELTSGHYKLVHLATHFYADSAGDEMRSFLVLAGQQVGGPPGFSFTLQQFEADLSLNGVDLLTLSACKTAVETEAKDGHEIDGLGGVGEELGASAVMASLWEVNDESTGSLMRDFYQRWRDGGGALTKVQALQAAQRDLLEGKVLPRTNLADPSAPVNFISPYYWAPFILMGNWQ
jgi:CHAT domain-containing protein